MPLGANRWQTLVKVVIPAAGFGHIYGYYSGYQQGHRRDDDGPHGHRRSRRDPRSFFEPVRPLTSTIAAEMGRLS